MQKLNIEYLNNKMKVLSYPDNHCFDVETLLPIGILENRLKLLKENAPELFEEHVSFLDIGSNKGFMCFILKDNYKKLVGYEKAIEICDFSNEIKEYHHFDNIKFIPKGFSDINDDSFDVVFVGNVHHYLYREDIKEGRKPLSFVNKLKNITNKYLIIDGCFENTDFAVRDIIKTDNWNEESINSYTKYALENKLMPEFSLVRGYNYNGIGWLDSSRHTAVFKKNDNKS